MEMSVSLEKEVAEILIHLRRWIPDADRAISSIINLRWGARKRRSAGIDDLGVHPLLSEHRSKKRRRGDYSKPPETSSPETPLDFSPSGDEAKIRSTPRKKLRESMIKQIGSLNRAKVEFEKEAAEMKNQLDALKEKNKRLKALREKMENERNRPDQEASTSDRHPTEAEVSQVQITQQMSNQPWPPRQWMSNHVVLHGAPPQWSWMNSQIWKCIPPAKLLPDLNSAADADSGEEFSVHAPPSNIHLFHHHQYHPKQEHQQHDTRRGSPAEQRAARKKRIEMIHTRRRIAAMR